MERLQNWCKQMENELNGEKKVVLISGASSSGKTFNASTLQEYLQKKGKKVYLLSGDNYYKGLTKIILQKTMLKLGDISKKYIKTNEDFENIYKKIREIIEFKEFPNKFEKDTIDNLNVALEFLKDDKETFISELHNQFNNINFDEPFCISFPLLVKDINSLINGKTIVRPEYSFKTSETSFFKKNMVNGSDYDYFIVEGLYTLRDELLSGLNKKNIIKTYVDCDLKSLLSRKLNRDIVLNRSTFTPEQTISFYITKVMPTFYEYIYPSKEKADYVLDMTITQNEINEKKVDNQIKFKMPQASNNLLNLIGFNLDKISYQTDYFLESQNGLNQMFVRLRGDNNLATDLNIKTKKAKYETANESYSLENFSNENRNIEKLLEYFKKSGFYVNNMFEKKRLFYKKGDVVVKYDKTPIGDYLEIDKKDIGKLKEIKYMLSNPIDESYYNLSCSLAQEHIEQEKKYLIKNDIDLSKYNSKPIEQYYFDKQEHLSLLQNLFKGVDFFLYSEMRIRKTLNKTYLTLKSKGDKNRKEIEKQIPLLVFEQIKNTSIGKIFKTRYEILEDNEICATIDVYKDIKILEIEAKVQEEICFEIEVQKLLKEFDNKLVLEDVTNNTNYKNSNLARRI